MRQANMLDEIHQADMHASAADWQLPDLPDLHDMDEVFIDLESTGLRWWRGDRMIGAGLLTPDGVSRYLPVRHKIGPNIPEDQFLRWCQGALRGKRIVNIRTKFDLHLFRKEGVDLEEQGCTFGDVAHYAALLDDHRTAFNQKVLVRDFLGDDAGKVTESHGYALDMGRLAEYPAGLVASRAEHDVRAVARLQTVMWPQLTDQDLHRVRELEDDIIPVVVEMEENGAPLNVELLNLWCTQATRDLEQALYDVQKISGCKLATPNKRDDLFKLFQTLRITIPTDPETGEPSYADHLLEDIPHPAIQRLRAAIQLSSLLSKFLIKYRNSVGSDGILRYELHQLPFERDTGRGGGGAVSGRFSSAAMTYFDDAGKERQEGANIQQVFGVKTQLDPDPITKVPRGFTRNYLVKKLFVPQQGDWMDADASQLQFRIFAHYANSRSIVDAYKNNPEQDYHDLVHGLIRDVGKRNLERTPTKNVNFAQVFGAGIDKMAEQLKVDRTVAEEISRIYHEMFPEVKPLLRSTSHLAMPDHKTGERACSWACRDLERRGYTHRGYVRTFLGRRARFGPNDRHYSALNRIIQGTEGDIVKRTLVEIHRHRRELALKPRFTVHDSWAGEHHDPSTRARVQEMFNTQYFNFRVPILWKISSGPNWAEAK